MRMKMAVRRFSAEAAAYSGDARFGGQGTVFLHPQSQISKKPLNHPNPDGPVNVKTPNSLTRLLSDFDQMLRSEPLPKIYEFSRVLTILSRMGHHLQVLSLYREMGLNHVPFNLLALNVVINSCCRLNNGFGVGYGFALSGAIVKYGFEPDAVTFTHLIKGLFLEGRGHDAVRLFQKSTKVCLPDVVTYATVIDGLCKTGDVDFAIGLFRDMKGGSCSPNTAIYNSICDGLCKIGRVDVTYSFVGEMVKKGVPVDHITFASLIKGLFLEGEANEALELFRNMPRMLNGVQPNLIICGIVIDGLCKTGNVVAAINMLRYLRGSYNPNVVIYSAIIDGLCKNRRVEVAFSFMGEMVKKGFVPNLVTFSTLIKGLFLQSDANSALRLFYKLTKGERIYQPDVHTYRIVIDGLCRMGNVDMAIGLFRDMEGGRCNPDIAICNSICAGLCNMGRADVAFSFMGEMVKKGVLLDCITFGTLIKGLFLKGEANVALELFHKLPRVLNCVEPNLSTYRIVIDGLCKMGNVVAAMHMLRHMKGSYNTNVEIYTAIIVHLCKDGKATVALSLMGEMVKKGFMPNLVIFTTLIKGLFLQHEPKSALRLFYKLTKAEKNYQPDKLTYGIVIDGLCMMGNVDIGIALFRDMEGGKCKPNAKIYTTIIDGLVKEKRVDEASSLLEEMVNNGVMPDDVTYNVMLNGFCIVGKLNEARELFNQLSTKGVRPTVYTYNTMIHGLCQEGFLEEAKEWLLKMEENGCKPDEVTFRTIISGYEKWNERHGVIDILQKMVEAKFSPHSSSLSKVAAGS